MSSIQKKLPYIQKKQGNKKHNEKKKSSTETNSEVTCLLELTNLSVKTIIITVFHMFKKLGELLNTEDIKKAQILVLEMINTMDEMKNVLLDEINN